MRVSTDATFVPIFCTLSPKAMTLMNVKLVCPIGHLGLLLYIHMELLDTKKYLF